MRTAVFLVITAMILIWLLLTATVPSAGAQGPNDLFDPTITPYWTTHTPEPDTGCKWGWAGWTCGTATPTPPPVVVAPTATPTLEPQCDGPVSFCEFPPVPAAFTVFIPKIER